MEPFFPRLNGNYLNIRNLVRSAPHERTNERIKARPPDTRGPGRTHRLTRLPLPVAPLPAPARLALPTWHPCTADTLGGTPTRNGRTTRHEQATRSGRAYTPRRPHNSAPHPLARATPSHASDYEIRLGPAILLLFTLSASPSEKREEGSEQKIL